MHTSFVLLVLRNPFSFSSASVTASTSIDPRSDDNPGPAPLLSDTSISDADDARMAGNRRVVLRGKESLGLGRWVWAWKVDVWGGVKSWSCRVRDTDMVAVTAGTG